VAQLRFEYLPLRVPGSAASAARSGTKHVARDSAAAQSYLGNLSANPYDANSSANPYGAGSPYRADGINNPYGVYGSPYSAKDDFVTHGSRRSPSRGRGPEDFSRPSFPRSPPRM
jgi:hypothetical protein